MALFELEDVTASRGGIPVLRGLTLRIEEGATAIVGPSGAGKSTLLRLLCRLADAESGAVRFRGEDVRALDPLILRRRTALVAQLPALLPGTVADNIAYAARLAGRRPRAGDALTRAGLDPALAERDAGRLSVGQQQRVMLARALAQEPEVLLLDEPTAALDEASREAVEATLRALRVPVVLVTHDRDQATRLQARTVTL